MAKIILSIFIFIHALIHLLGFVKAFQLANVAQLTKEISKPMGLLWLVVCLMLVASAVLLLAKKEAWWMLAIIAVVLSQIVLFTSWTDAKYGTGANLVVLVAVTLSYGSYRFEQTYKKDVAQNISQTNPIDVELLTQADIQHLPEPVQRYISYCNVLGKPKVKSIKVVFDGQMRDKGKDYFPFTSEQYNFYDEPTRLFFMKGKMFGITVPGYHKYTYANTFMDIRLFGFYSVVKHQEEIMKTTETVTFFNDMCLFAPAALIDERIQWQTIDNNTVSATFTNKDISVSATLYFNQEGQLLDFVSNNRTAVADMKQYPFSTPVHSYQNINGINVIKEGDAVWHYPDGKFTYGKFYLKEVQYNCN